MPLRAKETFFVGATKVSKGQLVNANDPIAKGRSALFDDTEKVHVPQVEQATAAPGEKRRIRLPGRSTAKAKPAPKAAAAAAPADAPAESDAPAGGLTTKSLPRARRGK